MNSCNFPKTVVPGLPLDCSSSTSSSSRPQPAVSMSSKGIVVSSVEVTPGRSLQKKDVGKGPADSTEIGPEGPSFVWLLTPPSNTARAKGKNTAGYCFPGTRLWGNHSHLRTEISPL